MKLVLPYPPALNRHWRVFRNRIIVSAESRKYKSVAQSVAMSSGIRPVEGSCSVTLEIYRPRKAGDLDGRLKVLFDCMNGIMWKDDSQIVEIHAYRYDDKLNPRAVISAEEIQ